MTTYTGGNSVRGGYYFHIRQWSLEMVEGESGVLPGEAQDRYVRVPALALLVAAPLMGLAFVILVPFIGIVVVAEQLGRKGLGWARSARYRRLGTATVPRR